MDIDFGGDGDDLLGGDGDLAFDNTNQLLADGCGVEDGMDDGGFNGVEVEDMDEDQYNDMGAEDYEALNEGKNSYLEMNKAASA